MPAPLRIEIAPGELIDKLTILEIKRARIGDTAKLANVEAEFTALARAAEAGCEPSNALAALRADLLVVNSRLWEIEDAIRDCERRCDFGAEFIALARAVYRNNDRRAEIKREINQRLGSTIVEEKSYAAY